MPKDTLDSDHEVFAGGARGSEPPDGTFDDDSGSEHEGLVGGARGGGPQDGALDDDSASEHDGLVGGASDDDQPRETTPPWYMGAMRRRFLALALLLLLAWRWRSTSRPSAFAQCHSSGPVLVGSHHKTGTVLLTHLLKDACRALQWKCVFNHDKVHCASAAEANQIGAKICLLQHGIQFKGLVPPDASGGQGALAAPAAAVLAAPGRRLDASDEAVNR